MKHVLLIGGASFIGLNLIEKFISENYKVIAYGRTEPIIKHENLFFIKGELYDVASKLSFIKSLDIHDAIYLVNNIPVNSSIDNYSKLLDLNKSAFNAILKLVNRLVFFSSGGRVYSSSETPHLESDLIDPICQYGRSKAELEDYLQSIAKNDGADILIIRPSNPYGKYQNIRGSQGLVAVLIGKFIDGVSIDIWGTGREVRDYIYICDFVEIFFKLLSKSDLIYNVYNISSNFGSSTLQVLELINNHFDVERDFNLINVSQPIVSFNVLSNNRVLNEVGDFELTSFGDGLDLFIKHVCKL
ncbi:NAD-dependent epimerase/dehydratase family protein [Shewanella sp. HL-SH8]|uniref:NAD-dependent epimerase/dehydratase family protein n=1 Tax=Shewanella sp. HL-SH8 TaxID=3436242 RepID=UPI003EBDA8BF